MHEMTLLSNVTRIVAEEMGNSGLTRLTRVTMRSGALAGLVPEAMRFAWEVLTESGPLMGVELVVEDEPVRLRCGSCGLPFAPREQVVFAACPACGEEFGHSVLAGREVFIESIEGEGGSEGGSEAACCGATSPA